MMCSTEGCENIAIYKTKMKRKAVRYKCEECFHTAKDFWDSIGIEYEMIERIKEGSG